MPIKSEVAEVLNGFEKRMKFVNIVRMLTEYKYPVSIRALFGSDTDKDRFTNVILAVMVFIKDRTLGEDLACTITDVQNFLEDISFLLPEVVYDSNVLAKFIIVDVLQHGGEIASFKTYSSVSNQFEMLPVRLLNEEHGKYTLTDDAFDFLFRIKDIDSTLDYSVTRFKMQEYMKRNNYQEALEQSRELVSRIRNIKSGINSFLIRCRENIIKVSVDDYETLVVRIRSLLEDEYRELVEIQKNARERENRLSDAASAGISYEEAKKHRRALKEIVANIEVTIEEQRSLINKKSNLSEQYAEILRESYRIVNFERLNFNEDIMQKLRKKKNLSDVAKFLLFPLTKPALSRWFSVENFYASQKSYEDMEDEDKLDLSEKDENIETERCEKRNRRNKEIVEALFSFLKDKEKVSTEDFILSLRMSELSWFCEENTLPQVLLSLYELGELSIEEWKQEKEMEIAPMGELELSWCMSQLSDELLTMSKIRFLKAEKTVFFEWKDKETKWGIEMSVFHMEVER